MMNYEIVNIIKTKTLESKLYKESNETEFTEYVSYKLVGYEHPDHPGKIFGTAVTNADNMTNCTYSGIYTPERFANVVIEHGIRFNIFGKVPTWDQCVEYWNKFVGNDFYKD